MSKLLQIAGVLLVAIGAALALMLMFASGSMQVLGLTYEVAAILLTGGLIAVGLGGVISAIDAQRLMPRFRDDYEVSAAAAAPAAAAAATAAATEDLSPEVNETIRALDKAKTELQQAFDEKPAAPAAAPEPVVEPEPELEPEPAPPPAEVEEEEVAATDAQDDGQLYVVEEKVIRGRPARILSDGTVEAETSEGWMRFENLEHLDEYLDAMEPGV